MQPATLHRLQQHTACKIQNVHQRAAKWSTGSGKGATLELIGARFNFHKISFLIQALLLWQDKVMPQKFKTAAINPKWPIRPGMGPSRRFKLNDSSIPVRKIDDGEQEKGGIMMEIGATTAFPVDRLMATNCSCQLSIHFLIFLVN